MSNLNYFPCDTPVFESAAPAHAGSYAGDENLRSPLIGTATGIAR